MTADKVLHIEFMCNGTKEEVKKGSCHWECRYLKAAILSIVSLFEGSRGFLAHRMTARTFHDSRKGHLYFIYSNANIKLCAAVVLVKVCDHTVSVSHI